jgi:DNA-binding transcriptional MerR regulator
MLHQLTIGDVARKTGIAVSAIRYYEECKLLPRADRQANNRRCYGADTLDTLKFISACRKNGMGVAAIRDLQSKLSAGTQQCEEAGAILTSVIKELSAKIAELQAARRHVSKVASACCVENCGVNNMTCNIENNMKSVEVL